jgi:hypothetical protein
MTKLPQPLEKDFEPAAVPGYGVSVLFTPTHTRYIYKITSGAPEPGCRIDRKGVDLSGYDDAQVEKYARKVALAFAASMKI